MTELAKGAGHREVEDRVAKVLKKFASKKSDATSIHEQDVT